MVEESMSNAGRTPPMRVFALLALQSCEFGDWCPRWMAGFCCKTCDVLVHSSCCEIVLWY